MKILLDTCTFLWLAGNSAMLSDRCRALFADPDNPVSLSVVSMWEILVKHGLGGITLPQQAELFRRLHRGLLRDLAHAFPCGCGHREKTGSPK